MEMTAIALVSFAVKLLVDVIRRMWVNADPTATNVIAFALGYAATYVPDVGDFTNWVSRANTAIVIAGVSSVVAEITKTLRARQVAVTSDSSDLR
jgi:hypothetical protein